jgi:hypothetical protein
MIQLQLNDRYGFGKVPPDVFCTDMQPGYTPADGTRFDHHTHTCSSTAD